MALAGELEIRMFAELARLRTDMANATSTVSRATKNIESAVASAKSALGALGIGISVIGFANMIKGSIDAMDHLNDLNKTTRISVETLAGLKVAAKQSGGDLDSIAFSINKLSVEMGKAPEKFRALGISAKDPLEAFKQLADIFNSLDNQQQRAALAAAALGRGWAGAAPLLAEGGKKIGEMVERGTKLSGVTTDMARQADALNDKWVLLGGTGGFVTRMVGPMLPLLNDIADALLKVSDHTLESTSSFNVMTETLRLVTIDLFSAWTVVKMLAEAIGVAAAQAAAIARGEFASLDAIAEKARERQEIMLSEHRKFIEKIWQSGKGAVQIPAPEVPVIPGAGANVDKFLGTGDAAAAKAAKEHAEAIRNKIQWLKAEAEYQAHVNDAINDAIEAGEKQNQINRESALAMEQQIADLAFLNDEERAATIAKNEQKQKEQQTSLESLTTSLMTEDELRKFAYERDFNLLNDTLGMKKEAQEQYYTLMSRLMLRNASQAMTIERQKQEAIRSMQIGTWQLGAELLQQFAGESKAAAIAVIAINKALAIAQVIQNTSVAVMRAFAELGPIAGTPVAATLKTLGAVQIGLISATGLVQAANVGGGGAAIGTPANPISTQPGLAAETAQSAARAANQQTTIINFQGSDSEQKLIRRFVDTLNENTKDGGRIIVK